MAGPRATHVAARALSGPRRDAPALGLRAVRGETRLLRSSWSRHDPVVLRAFQSADLAAVQALVVAAGLFTGAEVGFLENELTPGAGAFPNDDDAGSVCVVSTHDGGIVGVVLCRHEEAADGVWDLAMLAVDPNRQRAGLGRELVRHVEEILSGGGARLLAVRTSGTDQFRGARAFYDSRGYRRTATVPDWWADGDDLILYVKRLSLG